MALQRQQTLGFLPYATNDKPRFNPKMQGLKKSNKILGQREWSLKEEAKNRNQAAYGGAYSSLNTTALQNPQRPEPWNFKSIEYDAKSCGALSNQKVSRLGSAYSRSSLKKT